MKKNRMNGLHQSKASQAAVSAAEVPTDAQHVIMAHAIFLLLHFPVSALAPQSENVAIIF